MFLTLRKRSRRIIVCLTDSMIFCCPVFLLLIIACHQPERSQASLQGESVLSSESSAPQIAFDSAKGPISFQVELAKDDAARRKGLMFRDSLPANQGMLFIFDADSKHSFWMKNTKVPLDLVFLDRNWIIVDIARSLTPYSLESKASKSPCRYTLEINAGLADKYGLSIGTKAHFIEEKKQ